MPPTRLVPRPLSRSQRNRRKQSKGRAGENRHGLWYGFLFLLADGLHSGGELLELFLARHIGLTLFFEYDFAAGSFEFFFDQADALTAPTVGTEGESLASLWRKALQVAEEASDGRQHLVIDGRRANSKILAREDIRHDIGKGIFLDIVERGRDAFLLEGFRDGAGHHFRGMPHGIEDNDSAFLELARGPFLIKVQDFLYMAAPDEAMARRNHADIEVVQGLEGCLGLAAIEHEDIGIIFLGFKKDRG